MHLGVHGRASQAIMVTMVHGRASQAIMVTMVAAVTAAGPGVGGGRWELVGVGGC